MMLNSEKQEREGFSLSLPQIRLLELTSIFCIVYIAGEIAGFSYSSYPIAILFIGSAILNLAVTGLWNHDIKRSSSFFRQGYVKEWISIGLDLGTVLGLIYLTGTTESPFLFLLIVPLFFAGRLVPTLRAGFVVTSASIGVVAILGVLEINGLIPYFNCYPDMWGLFTGPHHMAGTILVLAGFMGLMSYLFNAFHSNFKFYFQGAEEKLLDSRRRILELTRLYDISLGINSVIGLDTLLKVISKEVTLLLHRPWASIVLVSRDMEIFKQVEVGENGLEKNDLDRGGDKDAILQKVMGDGGALLIPDLREEPGFRKSFLIKGRPLRSLLVVPIVSARRMQGLLMAGDKNGDPFHREDLRLLTILSDQVATAIEKSRLYDVMDGRIKKLEKENKTLENSNDLRMKYISHLSHELKTPLTSVKAYVESVMENIDNPGFEQRKEFLGIVSNETDRLIRMVNKVLDVSKIEFGQKNLKRNLFNLSGLMKDVESAMQPYLDEKGMNLIVKLAPGLPRVDGDRDLIKQVFINLLSNAVKFSGEGSKIFVDAIEDAVSIKVTVRDEGIGIAKEDLSNIFKQFYRAGGGVGEGVGLGLAIVKNIIEQHGGKIQVSSQMGKGSKFVFNLPKEHHFNDLLGYIFNDMDARDEIKELFHLSAMVIAELLSVKIVSIMLLDSKRKELFIKEAYGLREEVVKETRVSVGESIAGRVVESGEPLIVEDVERNNIKNEPNNPQYETKSLISVPLKVGSTVLGVINANNKISGEPLDVDDLNLLISLSERLSKVIERIRITEDSQGFLEETIRSLRSVLESCDMNVAGARKGIVNWAVQVSRKMGLSEKETHAIQYVASVHDVGMTTVGDDILRKTLELTPEEIEVIQRHPQKSEKIMRPFEFVEVVSKTILFHHERVDGNGYPMGLKGDQIPIGSRILAVLDAYGSMISERPFRKVMKPEEAIRELVRCSGVQFDHDVVKAFVQVLMDEEIIKVGEYAKIAKGLEGSGRHRVIP
jgi:signal transduction histidine kinase/HD-GYP domain-containing protein (c-di-GMP phosphodiesterase class II)